MTYEWNDEKRLINLQQHTLDFNDAWRVYEHPDKITLTSSYPYEKRLIDIAEVNGRVWFLVYTIRDSTIRCISLRYAKGKERKLYYEQDS